jgi:hypothetical protein
LFSDDGFIVLRAGCFDFPLIQASFVLSVERIVDGLSYVRAS